jgi:hypothetical protein
MPIRQDRMLALIRAARDYQQALATAIEMLHAAARDVPQLAYLEGTSDAKLLQEPTISAVTIAREHEHFRHAKRRNNRNASYIAQKRARAAQAAPIDDNPRAKFDPYRQLTTEQQVSRDISEGKYEPDTGLRAFIEAELAKNGGIK